MKIAFLLAFTLTVLGLQAQDEVEFSVRKKEPTVKTYFYKNSTYDSSISAIRTWFTCIQKVNDTLYDYRFAIDSLNTIPKPSSYNNVFTPDGKIDTSNNTYVATTYIKRNDTVWECIVNDYNTSCRPLFCNTVISLGKGKAEKRTYLIDKSVYITIDDTAYECIKLLETGLVGHGFRPNTKWLWHRTYVYLRKTDYLPVKKEYVSEVKKVLPFAAYEADTNPTILYKVLE